MVSSDLGGAWLQSTIRLQVQFWSAKTRHQAKENLVLTSWGDDGSVGNHDDWLLILALEVINDLASDLFESCEGSVWDSDKEVLSGGAIDLGVLHGLDAVDENDSEVGGLNLVLGFKLTKGLGDFFLEIGWLLSGFLDYFISSIEHVWYAGLLWRKSSS